MNKIISVTGKIAMCLALAVPVLTSCSNDDYDTQQYRGGVSLNVWGPRPVARGGELRFLGSGLNQITSITIPGAGDVTDIKVIDGGEIRITVPQTSEPGKVVLHHAGGDIESLTMLSFTEPISLDEMTPMPVKPGTVLTLKGDYLNLITEVLFDKDEAFDKEAAADKEAKDEEDKKYDDDDPENPNVAARTAVVTEEDFITHTRQEISLVVPMEARSGKIILSDGEEPLPNWIYSEEELAVVLPSVDEMKDLTKVKPGDTVEIPVNDIDLVKKVLMPNGAEVDYTVEDGKIKFVLPDNVSDGSVCVVPASRVKVAVATIGVAIPEEVVADPAKDIWAGDVIKFKGVNMELVEAVSFPNVENAVEPEAKSATEITVKVPEGAQSGTALLLTKSGHSVEVAISTLKPEMVSYSANPAALASVVKISGKNLQNVASVTFGDAATVEIANPAATEIELVIPATLSEGANSVVLTLTNGETVAAPAINLAAPVCAYATVLPGEDVEINAGETVTFEIANADKLTGVQVNGQDVQYILNGSRLIIQVPASAGKDSKVTLVSSNGTISYNIAVIPATHQERVVYNGPMIDLDWGGEEGITKFRINKEDLSDVPVGGKLVFHVTPRDGAQIQINDANWTQIGWIEPKVGDTTAELEITAELRDAMMNTEDGWSSTALIIQGTNCVVSKVTGEWEISLETTIWTGSWINTGWEGNQDLAWGGYDWSLVKPGSKLRIYSTPTVSGDAWWCISLRHADGWNNLPDPIPSQYDNPSNPLEVVLTEDVLKDLIDHNGLVITGSEYQLDKITIE